MKKLSTTEFRLRDVAEISVGSFLIAFPLAVTEEVWNLSAEISLARALLIALISIGVIALIIWSLIYHEVRPADRQDFRMRVAIAYGMALLISASMLAMIDRLPLMDDPILALKRSILVALPVCFGGTASDEFLSKQ